MKKSDLVSLVAGKTGLTKKDTDATVSALFDTIIEQVANGEKLQLVGFGIFECRVRNPRTGVNPRTGEKLEIAEVKVPAFKAGKAFKKAVNE